MGNYVSCTQHADTEELSMFINGVEIVLWWQISIDFFFYVTMELQQLHVSDIDWDIQYTSSSMCQSLSIVRTWGLKGTTEIIMTFI